MVFLYIPILFALGLFFINTFKSQLSKRNLGILTQLWIFHLLSGVGYYFFTRNGGGDAWRYWEAAKLMTGSDFWSSLIEGHGTYFMCAINYIPSNVMGMGFLSNTILFSLFGFMGMVFFYVVAVQTVPLNNKYGGLILFPTLFFLPNLHFWSSGIGKDSILFFCIGMFVYNLLHISKRIPMLAFSLVLAYFIRPHIVLFLLLAFGFAYLIDRKVQLFKRVLLFLLLLSISVAILPSVVEFAKIDKTSIESMEEFSANKAEMLSRGETDSRINTSTTTFPLKVFAFLYRPFFFDINGIPALICSLENLLLLLLSLSVLFNKPLTAFRRAPYIIKGLVIFLIIGTIAFSMTLGNIGIMLRMRNMFLPGLLIFVFWSFSYKQKLKKNNWLRYYPSSNLP